MAFQRLLLLEYGGGPEKDRDVCFCGRTFTRALPKFALPAGCPLACVTKGRYKTDLTISHFIW